MHDGAADKPLMVADSRLGLSDLGSVALQLCVLLHMHNCLCNLYACVTSEQGWVHMEDLHEQPRHVDRIPTFATAVWKVEVIVKLSAQAAGLT